MNIKLATATLGAALILAGSPAFAANVQPAPIHINQLTISGGYSADADGDSATILPAAANISFTNHYGFAATDVVFAVENHGFVVDRFDDAGSFANGVTINHKFAEDQANSESRVAVAKATFADGTVWTNPAVPQSTQPDPAIGVAVARF